MHARHRAASLPGVLVAGLVLGGCGGAETPQPYCAQNPCGANAVCDETSRSCKCSAGYQGSAPACGDVDECATGQHNCGAHATCTNTAGSFTCACEAGYAGDGRDCHRPQVSLRGLCVVVDFPNSRLEDYTGSGYGSLDDIRNQLSEMSAHWRWMSTGAQEFAWDVIRVQVPVNLSPGAYSGWGQFRNDIVRRARAQLGSDVSRYDGDRDGILDAVWIIPAADDLPDEYPFLTGGASRNEQAAVFVDAQDSLSARGRHTGNFNHEAGHCRGLPDVYGRYNTLNRLSLMANSWTLPAVGFSAIDKLGLGWLAPRVVDKSTSGITLRPAEDYLEAVLIPGVAPSEFVLIEYRKKPASGLGSAGEDYDGLAIYHVYEAASAGNGALIPFEVLEPADGALTYGSTMEPNDLWYPNNPKMLDAYRGKSYYGGTEFVSVRSFARTTDGISFDVTYTPPSLPASANLLSNADFEAGSAPWWTDAWNANDAVFGWEPTAGRNASACVAIAGYGGGVDARWVQNVDGLEVGVPHELRGWIKGAQIEPADPPDAATGANLSLLGTWTASGGRGMGSFDWRLFAVGFTPSSANSRVASRLGFYSSLVRGQAWFDDLALFKMTWPTDRVPAGATPFERWLAPERGCGGQVGDLGCPAIVPNRR